MSRLFTENGMLLDSIMPFPNGVKKKQIIGTAVLHDGQSLGTIIDAKKTKDVRNGLFLWKITAEIVDPIIVAKFKKALGEDCGEEKTNKRSVRARKKSK